MLIFDAVGLPLELVRLLPKGRKKSDRADYYKHKHLSKPAFPALNADIQRFKPSFPALNPAPNPAPNRHVQHSMCLSQNLSERLGQGVRRLRTHCPT